MTTSGHSKEEWGEEHLHRKGDISGILKDDVFDIVDKGDREAIIHKSLCQSRDTLKKQGLFKWYGFIEAKAV